ncbi:MAG TPA: cation diffusion facilitator family transporter [Croceicoccus sp.]|nr:cation diffusion facilitator family transporter [Croceicoccus sp.]
MSDCGCAPPPIETAAQKRALWIALILNAGMFVLEVWTGIVFNSAGLLADGLDMLSDAAVYAIALVAIGSSLRFKANAAIFSGVSLLILGIGLVLEVVRRLLTDSAPEGLWMIIIAMVALIVNVIVLRLLSRQRSDEVHMRAAWIFTRADVIANAAVVLSGFAVMASGLRIFDLIVGAAIGAYVIREAFEIISEARKASQAV